MDQSNVCVRVCECVSELEQDMEKEKEKLGESVEVGQKRLNVLQQPLGRKGTTDLNNTFSVHAREVNVLLVKRGTESSPKRLTKNTNLSFSVKR